MNAKLAPEQRAALFGLAVADPARLVDAIDQTLSTHPELLGALMHHIHGAMPTVRGPSPAREPTTAQREAVKAHFQVLKAPRGMRHPPVPTAHGDVDLTVVSGGDAAIVGSVLVDAGAVALLLADTPGDRQTAANAVSDLIAEHLGGPVTRISVTRRASTSGRRMIGRPHAAVAAAEDPHLRRLHTLQAFWPAAANHPRLKNENNEAYAKRLEGLMVSAAAAGDEAADAALDRLKSGS